MATQVADRVRFKPLGPAGGTEITGVNIARLDDTEFAAIRAALADTGVVVLRDQAITPAQHIAFARAFGGIDLNNYFPIDGAYPEIALVRKDKDQATNIGGGWHTDHSYDPVPALGSILVARELPPSGGDTLFIDMAAVFDALPEDQKDELRGLRAVHSADHIYGEAGYYANTDQAADLRGQAISAGAVHPAVIRHPDSGREVLYVNPAFTLRFDGWTREDSLPVLGRLYAAATRPRNIIRVQWRPGTVTIWDNRSTWHTAENDYHGHARTMHRITLTGVPLA